MDKFHSMRAFTRIVDHGSFSVAASTLGLPKATLTRMIQKLEGQLGAKLLHRSTRRIDVTSAGAGYYTRCIEILAEVEDAELSVTRESSLPRGTLRVAATAAIAKTLLVARLRDFFRKYPDLKVELLVTERNIDIRREVVDVVLRAGGPHDDTLVAKPIGRLDIGYFASPEYLARCGEPSAPHELSYHLTVSNLESRSDTANTRRSSRARQGANPFISSEVATDNLDLQAAFAVEGYGIALLPVALVNPLVEEGKLKRILLDWDEGALPLTAMYLPADHIPLKARLFVDWCAEALAEHGALALAQRPNGMLAAG
ncbi:LysR family transcriptional regulator [Cupriavidus sp. IDO]|uniref:LysR family transcriptional regulator n=1 Tax=Cupriavidus sp. IDO TaxID=1539142 RepID=UPI0005798F97|nr:LysR substrate-binding domain-containing protein [Cupriavidus sp. IDO]